MTAPARGAGRAPGDGSARPAPWAAALAASCRSLLYLLVFLGGPLFFVISGAFADPDGRPTLDNLVATVSAAAVPRRVLVEPADLGRHGRDRRGVRRVPRAGRAHLPLRRARCAGSCPPRPVCSPTSAACRSRSPSSPRSARPGSPPSACAASASTSTRRGFRIDSLTGLGPHLRLLPDPADGHPDHARRWRACSRSGGRRRRTSARPRGRTGGTSRCRCSRPRWPGPRSCSSATRSPPTPPRSRSPAARSRWCPRRSPRRSRATCSPTSRTSGSRSASTW